MKFNNQTNAQTTANNKLKESSKSPVKTYFWIEFVRRGGGMGARFVNWMFWDVMGRDNCFLARGGAGGRIRSDEDEMFDRVSSFELLLLLLTKKTRNWKNTSMMQYAIFYLSTEFPWWTNCVGYVRVFLMAFIVLKVVVMGT